MGNSVSTEHPFLARELDWAQFQSSTEWRSARAKELDTLGGAMRPCIGRGHSFSAKMEFLGSVVHLQGDRLQDILAVQESKKEADKKKQVFLLNTDRRALERRGDATPINGEVIGFSKVVEHHQRGEERDERSKGAEAVEEEASSGGAQGDNKQRPNSGSDKAPNQTSDKANAPPDSEGGTRQNAKGHTRVTDEGGGREQGKSPWKSGRNTKKAPDSPPSPPDVPPSLPPVAEWRQRVHKARRNVMLIVLTMVRLKRGKKHPCRFPRLDDLSCLVPSIMGTEGMHKFVTEQKKYREICEQTEKLKADLEDTLRPPEAAVTSLSPPESAFTSPSSANGKGLTVATPRPPDLSPAAAAAPHSPSRPRFSEGSSVNPIRPASKESSSSDVPEFGEGAEQEEELERHSCPPLGSPRHCPLVGKFSGPQIVGSPGKHSQLPPMPWSPSSPPRSTAMHDQHASIRPSRMSNDKLSKVDMSERGSGARSYLKPLEQSVRVSMERAAKKVYRNTVEELLDKLPAKEKMSSAPPGGARKNGYGKARLWKVSGVVSMNRHSSAGMLPTLQRNVSMPVARGGRVEGMLYSRKSADTELKTVSETEKSAEKATVVVSRFASSSGSPPTSSGSGGGTATRRSDGVSGGGAAVRHADGISGGGNAMRHSDGQSARPNRDRQPTMVVPPGGSSHSTGGVVHSPATSQSARPAGMSRARSYPGLAPANVVAPEPTPAADDPYVGLSPEEKAKKISEQLEEETSALKRSSQLLAMFVNRSNSTWANTQKWSPPDVMSATEFNAWLRGDVFTAYKVETQRKLRMGAVALQIFAVEDYFDTGSEHMQDVWTADPWGLVDTYRRGIMPSTDRVEGVTMGPRLLCNVILALKDQIGQEAVGRLNVVLHLNEEQQEEVTQDFWRHKFYGLNRTNVIFLVQRRHPGFRYCWEEKQFEAAGGHEAEKLQSMGSGYSLAQMAWASEAFMLSEEGLHDPLQLPAIEHLMAKKVEWVISRRTRDLALYSRSNCTAMDIQSLAYCMHQRDANMVNMVLEVQQVKTVGQARQYDSIVLKHAKAITKTNSPKNTDKEAAETATGVSKSFKVVELRHAELNTPNMIKLMEDMRADGRGTIPVSLNRCTYHLPSLKNLLTSFAVFRPKLMLKEELLHVSLDLADITAADKARTVAVEARQTQGLLLNARSLDALIPLVQAQDHDIDFREMVMSSDTDHSAAIVSGRPASSSEYSHTIVVFVVNNHVSNQAIHMAACLAKPGRDVIRLVTFVSLESQKTAATSMLQSQAKGVLLRSMTDTHCDAIVRGQMGLLDCMEKYIIQQHTGNMTVVMGSAQLTSNVFDYVVGSVTLSVIKRLVGVPIIVVTANAKNLMSIQPGAGFRSLVLVEGHAKDMLGHLCQKLIDVFRGDKLLLAQVLTTRHLTRQQQVNSRRLLENFHSICHGMLVPVAKTNRVEGQYEHELCQMVEEDMISLLGLQLPPGTKSLSTQMLNLLRSNRGATLVYQSAGDRSILRHSVESVTSP